MRRCPRGGAACGGQEVCLCGGSKVWGSGLKWREEGIRCRRACLRVSHPSRVREVSTQGRLSEHRWREGSSHPPVGLTWEWKQGGRKGANIGERGGSGSKNVVISRGSIR